MPMSCISNLVSAAATRGGGRTHPLNSNKKYTETHFMKYARSLLVKLFVTGRAFQRRFEWGGVRAYCPVASKTFTFFNDRKFGKKCLYFYCPAIHV